MGYLIIGLVLGVTVSWFWQRQFSGVPVFEKLMQKELAVNGQLGSLKVLKSRLDYVERRLAELEQPERALKCPDNETGTTEFQAVSADNANRSGRSVVRQISSVERKVDRSHVLKMWEEGLSLSEIVSRTGRGKGEIELILSMQEGQVHKKG